MFGFLPDFTLGFVFATESAWAESPGVLQTRTRDSVPTGKKLSAVIHQLLSLKKSVYYESWFLSQHINLSKPEAFPKVCSIPSHRPLFKLLASRKKTSCTRVIKEKISAAALPVVHVTASTTEQRKQMQRVLLFCTEVSLSHPLYYNTHNSKSFW